MVADDTYKSKKKQKNKNWMSKEEYGEMMEMHKKKMHDAIINNGHKLWLPLLNAPSVSEETHSCHDMIIKPKDMEKYLESKRIISQEEEISPPEWDDDEMDTIKRKNIEDMIDDFIAENLKDIQKANIINYENTNEIKEINYKNTDEIKEISYKNTDKIKEINYKNTDKIKETICQNKPDICNKSKKQEILKSVNNIIDNIAIINNDHIKYIDNNIIVDIKGNDINCVEYVNLDINDSNNIDDVEKLSDLEFDEEEVVFSNTVTKSRQVLIFPDARQRKLIDSWFNATTAMYNHTVKHIKSWSPLKTFLTLRSLYIDMKKLEREKKDLDTRMKKNKTKKDILYKYMNVCNDPTKTKKEITLYNKRVKEYSELKQTQKRENEEKQLIYPKLAKKTKEYKELSSKIYERLNFETLRTKILYDVRNNIISKNVWKTKEEEMKRKPKAPKRISIKIKKSNRQSPTIQHENSVPVFIMDATISTVCSLFKAALTKIMRGTIKHFRIRNHTHDRRKKVMDIEYTYIKTGEISKLGPMKMKLQQHGLNKMIDYKLTSLKTIKLHYDTKYNRYSFPTNWWGCARRI